MAKIQILSDVLANKIAAGEVVERPASVVKELLENALDAGAKRIRLETDAGGKQFIKITDDGEGMEREDAMMAFERHATSKLKDIDDLEQIQTLGFRGEALPSIASVANLRLRTKTAQELEGTEIEIAGGRILHIRDVAWPGGTEFEIRDLFFNVPARRKFLKSDSTEGFHITNLVTHYALANPQISFTLIQNGREVIAASPVESLKERAYQLFGADFIENLIEINAEGEISLQGFVSKPQEQRASRDSQYLFVNGRFVRDKILSKAINDAYKNVIPAGSYPVVMLMVAVPSTEVDVNAHPAKTEVRFRRPYVITEAISTAIRASFAQEKPFANFPVAKALAQPSLVGLSATSISSYPATPMPRGNLSTTIPPSLFTPVAVPDPFEVLPQSEPATSLAAERLPTIPLTESANYHISPPLAHYPMDNRQVAAAPTKMRDACGLQTVIAEPARLPGTLAIKPLGQLRDSYIVALDDKGLMLIDQHVAHERVLFEQHLARIKSQSLEVQSLLIPETIDLTPAQAGAFDLAAQELALSGFELMRLSGRTIAIQAAPAMLSVTAARQLVLELLGVVEQERRALSLEDFQREIAASVACHAAIKVNMPLTEEKMRWLIDELMKTECPTNCPHGRPIILRFTMQDIERGFKRI